MVSPQILLVGCGQWGRNIARNLSALGALYGVADQNPAAASAFADEFNSRVIPLNDGFLDAAIDGVAITASAAAHADLAERFLHLGKATYIEKPLALSLADAARIQAAANSSGGLVMVGHLLRYHRGFQAMLSLVQDGAIGGLRHITAHRLAAGRIRASESVIYDLCPHDLSMIAALVDYAAVERVDAHGVSHITQGITDSVTAQIAFSGGVAASLQASWFHPIKHHQLCVIGCDGALVFDDTAAWPDKLKRYGFSVDKPTLAIADNTVFDIALDAGEPLRDEMQHFLDSISSGDAPLTGLSDGLYVQGLLSAIEGDVAQKPIKKMEIS